MPDEVNEVTKTVDGESYPASDFLVVEDQEAPSSWHLQVKKHGTPDRGLAGAAWAALFNPGGYRGNKYEGPGKSAAQDALRALYTAEEWEMPTAEAATDETPILEPVAEQDAFVQLRDHLQAALEILAGMIVTDEEPEAPEPEPAEAAETLVESAALQLVEAEPPTNRRAPLRLDVGIIKVGPGNERDRHYYSGEMLERDGGVFKGAKMYATDHRNDEKSVRTEVSLLESIAGVREFADGQYLVGRAVVFNPDFAEDVRNRADAGVLNSLHCSILAKGEAQPGKVGEQDYNIVTRIAEAQSVDWVTRAGAGGHALQLTEAAAEPEPEEAQAEEVQPLDESAPHPVTLSEDKPQEVIQPLALAEVVKALGETNLPASSVAQLASAPYVSVSEVKAAVAVEVARLKAAGSGRPLGIASAPPPVKPKSLSELQAELQAVNQKWLGR
jgi:hypothetical protein